MVTVPPYFPYKSDQICTNFTGAIGQSCGSYNSAMSVFIVYLQKLLANLAQWA